MESVDGKGSMSHTDSKFNQEIHSKVVRAGKRTYFFDVKSTRKNEYYLTITESKKRFSDGGKFHFEKHKVFLYKEDFEKFVEGLQEVVDYIRDKQPVEEMYYEEEAVEAVEEEIESKFTNVGFEEI